MKFIVTVECDVEIEVEDENAITRCVENEDGWQDTFYDLDSRDKVLNHWAYNCVANGVEDASRLDGWGDLPRGTVTMSVDRDLYYDRVREVSGI